jgi:hypothetical protein
MEPNGRGVDIEGVSTYFGISPEVNDGGNPQLTDNGMVAFSEVRKTVGSEKVSPLDRAPVKAFIPSKVTEVD